GALAVETAAFLHESLENKTSFSSLAPPPEKALFSDTSLAREGDLLVPASAPEALESKVSNSFALRKTINVDLKALSSQSSGGGREKQGTPPIELRFSKGSPEKKVMGRSPECEIVVDSADASRRHCMLTFDGTHLIVKDLASSNGTFLNNRVVIE